jgi:hypothetical protein
MRGRLLGMLLPIALGSRLLLPDAYGGDDVAWMGSAPAVQASTPSPIASGPNYPPTSIMTLMPLPDSLSEGREPEPGVKGWLQRHGFACWSHHDSPGCGSLEAECTFIFGSCRKWYGEPCMPRPDPYPPVAPGYGAPTRTRCGCSW